MTVYVDDANIPASVQNGNRTHTSQWCHLSADTEAELHDFAAKLGLKRAWFQHAGRPTFHYDLTAGKRAQAVAHGATQITYFQMGELTASRRPPAPAQSREVDGPALADRWAAESRALWEAGKLAAAAYFNHACGQADPSRADLWQSRRVRLLDAAERKSLAERNAIRLAVAGIGPDDPGVRQVSQTNEIARAKAPESAQREAS